MAKQAGAGAPTFHQLTELDPEPSTQTGLAPSNKLDTAFVLRTLQRVTAERDHLVQLARDMGYTEEAIQQQLQAAWPHADADSQVAGTVGRKPPQANNGEPHQ